MPFNSKASRSASTTIAHGALKLAGGGGINLKDFDPLTVLIEKNSLGTWSLQRETQELMLQKFERTEKKSRMHEPKPKKSMKRGTRQ